MDNITLFFDLATWIEESSRLCNACFLCSVCCVDTHNLLLQYWCNKWKVDRAVVMSSYQPVLLLLLTVLPVVTEWIMIFCTINVARFSISVPGPGQILENPASVWSIHYSCSAQILLGDAAVELKIHLIFQHQTQIVILAHSFSFFLTSNGKVCF